MATTTGNHGTVPECVEALQREVSALRITLRDRTAAADATVSRTDPSKPRWKFRAG